MRDASFAVIRAVRRRDRAGSNIQFAVTRPMGRMVNHRNEPPRVAVLGLRLRRPPAFPSPRSPPSSRWVTCSTRSATTYARDPRQFRTHH